MKRLTVLVIFMLSLTACKVTFQPPALEMGDMETTQEAKKQE